MSVKSLVSPEHDRTTSLLPFCSSFAVASMRTKMILRNGKGQSQNCRHVAGLPVAYTKTTPARFGIIDVPRAVVGV